MLCLHGDITITLKGRGDWGENKKVKELSLDFKQEKWFRLTILQNQTDLQPVSKHVKQEVGFYMNIKSRGGLEVEEWSDNRTLSISVNTE